MFGFRNKQAKTVDEAERYIRSMFAGLEEAEGKHLPRQVFSDPYVVGFLQVLTIHSTAAVYQSRKPDQTVIDGFLSTALNRLFPGNGTTVTMRLAEFTKAVHPLHAEYLRGRSDGSEHVRALLATYENLGSAKFHSFREHVIRRYL